MHWGQCPWEVSRSNTQTQDASKSTFKNLDFHRISERFLSQTLDFQKELSDCVIKRERNMSGHVLNALRAKPSVCALSIYSDCKKKYGLSLNEAKQLLGWFLFSH